jgi:putative colanic acid biosynthesis acetyltransferase WcaF
MILPKAARGSSPWSLLYRIRLFLWASSWTLLCRWTPKPLNPIRVAVLRIFGAKISPGAFIHQRARIAHPWNLTMGVGACLGDRAQAYSLSLIDIQAGATVAQEAYLCTGTHDFSQSTYPLTVSPIVIEPDAFVGARAFVLPGVTIGRGAIVGACSVVTRSVPPYATVAGNPARPLY